MEISVVYSIGIRCYTEVILKRLNLVKFSSIFGSMNIKNYDNLRRCFDSFEVLFDPQHLVYTRDVEAMSELNAKHGFRTLHRLFDDVTDYHSSTIAHHDLSNEDHKAHFDRGLKRLEYIKANKVPILFVSISHDPEFKNDFHDQALIDSMKTCGFNMKVLSIYCDRHTRDPPECVYNDGTHIVYRIPSVAGFYIDGGDTDINDEVIRDILNKHFTFAIKEIPL